MTKKDSALIEALRCAGSVHEIDEDLGCGSCPYAVELPVPQDERSIFDVECDINGMLLAAARRLERVCHDL